MWRFNEARQDHGPDRRRGNRSRRRTLSVLEPLEGRNLLSGGGPSLPALTPANVNSSQVQSATKTNVDPDLSEIYELYHQYHSDFASLAALFPELRFQGNAVLIGVEGQGYFQTLIGSLRGLGMQVTASYPPSSGGGPVLFRPISFVFRPGPAGGGTQVPTSSTSNSIVDGYLPIDQLPAVAALPQVVSVSALHVVDVAPFNPATPPVLPPTLPPAPPPIVIPPPPIVIPLPPVLPPTLPPAPPPIVIPPPPFKLPLPPSFPDHSPSPPSSLGIVVGIGGHTQGEPTHGTTGGAIGSKSALSVDTPATPAPAAPPHRPFQHRAWSRRVFHRHAVGGLHHGGQIHIDLERTGRQAVLAKHPTGPGLS